MTFGVAPLKIITKYRKFVDDKDLVAEEMVEYLGKYKGKSKTSCPNPADRISVFGDADDVICVTITGGLSGSYNSACAAECFSDMIKKRSGDAEVEIHPLRGLCSFYAERGGMLVGFEKSDA